MQPTPEPRNYVDAQIAALMDPSSARDTVLVTPGSAMPSRIPSGLIVAQTSRGLVITKDPAKVAIIDRGTEEQAGQALFGYGYDQSKGAVGAAVATNPDGVPVAELAVPGDHSEILKALHAASLLAPEGGSVSLQPKQAAIAQRVQGLLGA